MKRAIVTGAAGFAGSILTETLRIQGIEVYAIVRPGSPHNKRLDRTDQGLHIIETDMDSISEAVRTISSTCDVFFHLAWGGGRNDFEAQKRNIDHTLMALSAAGNIGCHRIVITGSQAEYGIVPPEEMQTEDRRPEPYTAYGSAKVAACYLSRQLSTDLGIDWVWGRIFSLIGKNEPDGRMLPDLYHALDGGKKFKLSSGCQNWDFLDVYDAAEALIALAKSGRKGEIYNIAKGDFRRLREYTEELRQNLNKGGTIEYGEDAVPFVSLQPCIEKIRRDTGWSPCRSFAQSIADYQRQII